MRRPRFAAWAKRYLLYPSGLDRFDFRRLALMAESDRARVREHLLLYAVQTGRYDELMSLTGDAGIRREYAGAKTGLEGLNPESFALSRGYDAHIQDRYGKILNSFHHDWHRPEREAWSKGIQREAALRAQRRNGVSVNGICQRLGLNTGNVNHWLEHDDPATISLDNATRFARAMMTYEHD